MKLGEFIENFSHNNLIRLHYKIPGGNTCVLDDFDEVSMDWEVNKNKGPYSKYKNHKVIGLASEMSSSILVPIVRHLLGSLSF